jgi:hypothetical protein
MDDYRLIQRFSLDRLSTALRDTPVVMVVGPRQCGKTTLVRTLMSDERAYVTLDDDTVLQGALADPTAFVRNVDRITIDEVQRAPDLLRAIKRSVDQDRRPGRFLLTGSADVLTLPAVSESLAGRLETITLLPVSHAETRDRRPEFLRAAFTGLPVKPPERVIDQQLVQIVLTGGYPEMLRRTTPGRRHAWGRDYLRAIVQRDVREIADVEKVDQMSRLLRVLAHHSGQLTNFTQIGGQNNLDDKTTKKYVAILEQLFLVRRLEPWFRNRLKRLVKTPRLHFLDSGLLAAILGLTAERIARDRTLLGPVLETFVFSEILKQTTWLEEDYSLWHYRDKDQDEVDIVVENESGALVGLEVKAAATVRPSDFKGLRKLAGATGDALLLGLVLYDGDTTIPFGDRLFAAPVSCLWG